MHIADRPSRNMVGGGGSHKQGSRSITSCMSQLSSVRKNCSYCQARLGQIQPYSQASFPNQLRMSRTMLPAAHLQVGHDVIVDW